MLLATSSRKLLWQNCQKCSFLLFIRCFAWHHHLVGLLFTLYYRTEIVRQQGLEFELTLCNPKVYIVPVSLYRWLWTISPPTQWLNFSIFLDILRLASCFCWWSLRWLLTVHTVSFSTASWWKWSCSIDVLRQKLNSLIAFSFALVPDLDQVLARSWFLVLLSVNAAQFGRWHGVHMEPSTDDSLNK